MIRKLIILALIFVILPLHAGKSNIQTILPILAALQSAQNNFLSEKPEHTWNTVNKTQQLLIKNYVSHIKDLEKLSPDELEVCASRDNEVLNALLLKHGCQVHVEPFDSSRIFGIASILNLIGDWVHEGDADGILYKNMWYKAVIMDNGVGYDIMDVLDYGKPMIRIETKQGDVVSLIVADQERTEFDLITTIEKIRAMKMQKITNNYSAIKFPMVDLTYTSDLAWLIGMNKVDKELVPVSISNAVQETKLKMDRFGFVAQSAVVLKMEPQSCSIPNCVLEIDEPFFVWIERKDVTVPLLMGYVDREDWNKPNRTLFKREEK